MRHPRNSFRLGQWAVSTKHHHPSLSLYWYDLLLIEPGNSFESVESWFTTVPCLIKIELFILSCICRFVFLQRRHGLMTTTIGFAFPQRKNKCFSISLFWRIQNNKSFPPFLLFNFRSLSNRLPHQLNFVLLFFTFGFDSFVRAISILNRCQYTHCNWNFIILRIISCFPIILETYFHCGLNVTQ